MTTARMAGLYRRGWSYRRIARRAGLSPTAVRLRLLRAGVPSRRIGTRQKKSYPLS